MSVSIRKRGSTLRREGAARFLCVEIAEKTAGTSVFTKVPTVFSKVLTEISKVLTEISKVRTVFSKVLRDQHGR